MLVKCFCTKSNSIMVIKWFVEILAFVNFAPKKTQNDSKKVRGQDNVVMLIQRFLLCLAAGCDCIPVTIQDVYRNATTPFFPFSRNGIHPSFHSPGLQCCTPCIITGMQQHTANHYRNATTRCFPLSRNASEK